MKIYLATDHAGFALKEKIKAFLIEKGYEIEDNGAFSLNNEDDYPDFVSRAAEAVSNDLSAKAIIFGGSAQGEAIVANKYPNVRAVIFYGLKLPIGSADATGRASQDPYEILRLTREHNDANVLSLSARFLTLEEAEKAIEIWLNTPFSNGERHMRRIQKIKQIERTNS